MVLAGACAVSGTRTAAPSATTAPSSSPSNPAVSISPGVIPDSPLDGVVIGIDQTSLVDVQSFTVRTSSGQSYEFRIGQLDNAEEFPPSHLSAHMADGVPVRVTFHLEGTDLVATHLDDAP